MTGAVCHNGVGCCIGELFPRQSRCRPIGELLLFRQLEFEEHTGDISQGPHSDPGADGERSQLHRVDYVDRPQIQHHHLERSVVCHQATRPQPVECVDWHKAHVEDIDDGGLRIEDPISA